MGHPILCIKFSKQNIKHSVFSLAIDHSDIALNIRQTEKFDIQPDRILGSNVDRAVF